MAMTALIVAAGTGQRVGGAVPKQYQSIGGKALVALAVDALASHPAVAAVRVAIGKDQHDLARVALGARDVELVEGGATRAQSVQRGLAGLKCDAVLVHDAARPFCPADVIDRLVAALEFNEGAAPVIAVTDTLARAGSILGDAVDRNGLVRVQTPQAARLDALRTAQAAWSGPGEATDETSMLRAAGMRVAAVEGAASLEKITTAEDYSRAAQWLGGLMVPRTGSGFDVHAFAGEGPLLLGGIEVPHDRGLAGHSDADVVLHAITDALLGAAALGDIGDHFPPSDPQWRGAASHQFLGHARDLVAALGAVIDSVDCTIIAEAPKIGPHREAMRARIAEILALPVARVSVKATTTERLGFTGRSEGIAAQAVANIRMPD